MDRQHQVLTLSYRLKRFTNFYATKHKNHKLYWYHLIGTTILKGADEHGLHR
jgi:hypothetical protein